MKLLFIGDVFGRSGREALQTYLPDLKDSLQPDAIIVNGDNAAHGRGITRKICDEFFNLGVDCITGGDHIWDQNEIIAYIDQEKRLIRPANYAQSTPGMGVWEKTFSDGRQLTVIHLQGQIFMKETDSAFWAVNKILESYKIGSNKTIFVDFHCEATSEKVAMGHFLDGRVSAVIGTHTHVPTADAYILDGGTAYQSDAGMTGDYKSVIGARIDDSMYRFTTKMPRPLVPAEGEATLCGAFVVIDDKTGLAVSVDPVRRGPFLPEAMPPV